MFACKNAPWYSASFPSLLVMSRHLSRAHGVFVATVCYANGHPGVGHVQYFEELVWFRMPINCHTERCWSNKRQRLRVKVIP